MSLGLVLATVALLSSPNPADLTIGKDQTDHAERLVALLHDRDFKIRDKATKELSKMGRLALPTLLLTKNDPDPEVRLRVNWLIPNAEANELQARLAAFQADVAGQYEHQIPGWKMFSTIAGTSESVRKLFTEVVANPANTVILKNLGAPHPDSLFRYGALGGGLAFNSCGYPANADLAQAVLFRRYQLYIIFNTNTLSNVRSRPDTADLTLLLLAESFVTEKSAPPGGMQFFIPALFDSEEIKSYIEKDPAFRKLVLYWLDSRHGINAIYNAYRISIRLGFPANIVNQYAVRMITTPGASPNFKMYGLLSLVNSGASEHLSAIVSLFDDSDSLPGRGDADAEVEVRDIALISALILTKQDPLKYGFSVGAGVKTNQANAINFGFTGDDGAIEQKREAAFAQWQSWADVQRRALIGSSYDPELLEPSEEK